MSSRVQKGNTIFKPVAKARSRAPTVPPSQSLSQTPDLSANFQDNSLQLAPTPSPFLPIPSTAVPSREPRKQTSSTQLGITPPTEQPPLNTTQETPVSARETIFPTTPIPSHTPPVLINTSNLPPTLINVGHSINEPANARNTQPCHDNRALLALPQPFHIPVGLPMTSGPSQQNAVIFDPSVPIPTELSTTLVSISSFENLQQPPLSGHVHVHQPHGDETEKPKRKRKTSQTHSESEMEGDLFGRKTRSRSTTPRQRRSRGPSLPPFDPDADPGEDIDPTVVTMATLCSDTGQGRVSSKAAEILSNHVAWKARNKERRVRMRTLMEAKKYGREVDEETQGIDGPAHQLAEARKTSATSLAASTNTSEADEETGIDYSQQLEPSRYNVQVRIGPNGETIIDEESLVVDRAENEDTSNYTHVVESDHTKFVNSGTYGKRYRGSRWSAEETELFYNALSQYGENYELIAYVLPGRDRKSCKNKFKAEDKKNHARINYCLNNRIPVDVKTLERMTGKDFSGPVPEIRAPPPPPIIQPGSTQGPENTEGNTTPMSSAKQVKKRSSSRTAGLPEEGVVIVGDVDSVPS